MNSSLHVVKKGLTVDCSQGRVGTRIISLSDIASRRRCKVRSGALVARDLGSCRLTSGKIEKVSRVGWMVEMTVKPPLGEGVVDERSDGSVVVRVSLLGHVEPVHARMEERSMGMYADNCERKERKGRESEHCHLGMAEFNR